VNHSISGYWSSDGIDWLQVGQSFTISSIDSYSDFSTFTGTRQGLYVQNRLAYFDFYIYRDAYTPILSECPANQNGTTRSERGYGLDNISNGDWALYAGVEFGRKDEYSRNAVSVEFNAACAGNGGTIEVWLDSLDVGTKIAECPITSTGSSSTFQTFTAALLKPVSEMHDLYLKFVGTGSGNLFILKWLQFVDDSSQNASVKELGVSSLPFEYSLEQNYPNPFNPTAVIQYAIPKREKVVLKVYSLLGQEVATLVDEIQEPSQYKVTFDGRGLASGVYFYKLQTGYFSKTKKMVLAK
ncbi:MAG: carbohydrate-binding protein, partial [Bacteroidetes bacterium]|nr:carbohydrate-binding protein [Bacteroidota bacterium]